MKKLIAFDLDGTLAPSKSSISPEMDQALSALLEQKIVCVISGGKFKQFKAQLLDTFSAVPNELEKLHLMPTSGTHYLRYRDGEWQTIYREIIPEADRKQIIAALQSAIEEFNYDQLKTYGQQIEDRESQVTLSVFGQDIVDQLGDEGVNIKTAWDPTMEKRLQVVDYVTPLLPNGVVAATGGKSSIDVVMEGVDKSYGIQKLIEELGIVSDDVLFIGDALHEDGNDYPVKKLGIDTIAVDSPDQALSEINKLLGESSEQ